ncbi:XRE family transcriptional regulator [Hymenobacter sp. BT175]|uniref:XRE family transcriptional regulator n=1 Tax=Hymenobacter translucens TaxID=2886507 RepID=UPI001D0EAC9C|nr:XRE family transcriptional regulator [Hymenobacter translucens]MCC2548530.1 XRE family transcriptional regulator [Hymenobacter translucens]
MLELARSSRGITQKELAALINRTQAAVSQWEHNLREPNEEDISLLSNVLNYPTSFFYQQEIDVYLPPVQGHYRKKAALKAVSRTQLESHFRLLGGWVNKLQDAIEVEDGIASPDFSDDTPSDASPEDLARQLRAKWRVPNGPIRSLTTLLENHKIVVAKTWMFNENVDGYSFHTNSGMPVIYVNREMSIDRMRFSIAHELGHLVMHSDCLPDEAREKEAHRFAAEFLMPSHDIHDQLINLRIEGLMSLKARWGSSMTALVRRGRDLGLLNEDRYKSLLIGLSPYRKKEPVDLTKHGFVEQPQLMSLMMRYHLDEVGMTTTQIRDMLHLNDGDFSQLMLSLGLGSGGMYVSHR